MTTVVTHLLARASMTINSQRDAPSSPPLVLITAHSWHPSWQSLVTTATRLMKRRLSNSVVQNAPHIEFYTTQPVSSPHVAVLEAVAAAPRRMPRHSAPRLPAPSLRPTPRRWACGRCLTAATRPLLRSGYSRWSGAIIASRSVRRAELRRDARGLPAWPFGRAVEHFFCTDPVWPESVHAMQAGACKGRAAAAAGAREGG